MTLIETPASAWAREAFKNFGRNEKYDAEALTPIRMSINPTSKHTVRWQYPDSNDIQGKSESPVTMWHLLDTISGGSDQLLLNNPGTRIVNSYNWPTEFNMYYNVDIDYDPNWRNKIISSTVIWKYFGVEALGDLLSDVKAAVARVERKARLEKDDAERETLKQEAKKAHEGLGYVESVLSFINSLSKGGLPNDFMNISTEALGSACGNDNWSFTLAVPHLRFDIVTIENISKHRMILKDLIGAREMYSGFRKFGVDTRQAAENASLELGPINLEAGQRVGVMLRVLFKSQPEHEESEEGEETQDVHELEVKSSNNAYKYISSRKQGFIFTEKIAGFISSLSVRKRRESFKSPTFPEPNDYAYGPEISVVGLKTGSDARDLSGAPATSVLFQDHPVGLALSVNEIDVLVSQPGSCPRLYIWNGDVQDWVVHGKIIHSANGVSRKMTERLPLKTVSTRFRIAEEELEVAYIDDLRLRLKLVDGREFLLAPRSVGATVLTMNTHKDVDFDFPAGVSAEDVAQSELIVTGYYRRYSDILKELALGDAEKAHLGVNRVAR